MIRQLAALSLLLPGLALGQSAVNVQVSGVNNLTISSDACGTELVVTWTLVSSLAPTTELAFWSTAAGTCGDTPAAGDKSYPGVPLGAVTSPANLSDSFKIQVDELPIFSQTDGGIACGASGVEGAARICAAFSVQTFNGLTAVTQVIKASPATITYDSKPSAPPTLSEAIALDQALAVNFSAPTEGNQVLFEIRPQGTEEFSPSVSASAQAASVRITGLDNGTTYEVRARTQDAAGNLSDPSNIVSGTPVPSDGFFAIYRRDGGTGQGGCAVAGGSTLAVLGALAAAGFVSRRRRS